MGATVTYRFRPTILKDSKELVERGCLLGNQRQVKDQIRAFKRRGFALCLEETDPTGTTPPRLSLLITLVFVGETETVRLSLYPPRRGIGVDPYPTPSTAFIRLCHEQLEQLFFNHSVHRVEWLLPEDRPELHALAERIGFTWEGRLRSALAADFYYQDALMVSLLRPENALSNYGFVNFGWFLVAVYGDEQWIKGSDLIPFGSGVADAFLFDCLASKELIDEEGKVTNAFAQLKIGEFLLSGQVRLRPVEQACRELSGYIKGERTRFEVPLDPTRGTEFQQKVWRALRQIPYGQVQSYEEVANRVLYYSELDQGADDESAATEWEQSVAAAIASGTREPEDQSDAADAANDNVSAAHLYARAVGAACGANPFLLFVPCHRVLSKDGKLTGFSSGIENKGHLLDFEIMGAQPDCNIHRDQ